MPKLIKFKIRGRTQTHLTAKWGILLGAFVRVKFLHQPWNSGWPQFRHPLETQELKVRFKRFRRGILYRRKLKHKFKATTDNSNYLMTFTKFWRGKNFSNHIFMIFKAEFKYFLRSWGLVLKKSWVGVESELILQIRIQNSSILELLRNVYWFTNSSLLRRT